MRPRQRTGKSAVPWWQKGETKEGYRPAWQGALATESRGHLRRGRSPCPDAPRCALGFATGEDAMGIRRVHAEGTPGRLSRNGKQAVAWRAHRPGNSSSEGLSRRRRRGRPAWIRDAGGGDWVARQVAATAKPFSRASTGTRRSADPPHLWRLVTPGLKRLRK
jgi:hypothetical protein